MGQDTEAVSIFGPLPWPYPQESGAAELAAAIEGLQNCIPLSGSPPIASCSWAASMRARPSSGRGPTGSSGCAYGR
eukprot:5481-Pyramimonas_sp.AAC.1